MNWEPSKCYGLIEFDRCLQVGDTRFKNLFFSTFLTLLSFFFNSCFIIILFIVNVFIVPMIFTPVLLLAGHVIVE